MTFTFDRSRTAIRSAALVLLLAAAPAGLAFTGSRPQIEREFSRTLPLAAGRRLQVEHANGEVAVKARPGSDVRIHAWIRVSAVPESEAKAFADAIRIEAEPDAGDVSVRTRYPERRSFGKLNISYSVDYDIEMPEGCLLEVRTRFGSVSASGVKGGTRVDSSNGSVTLKDGGGLQKVSSSFGAVSVTGAAGDVTVTNGNGDVTVSGVAGAADLTTRFGKISATKVAGSVTISGGNGDVTLADCGAASVEASFGAVRFTNVKKITSIGSNGSVTGSKVAGTASVRNSFGTVELSDVTGRVDVENANGNVRVIDVHADAHLRTSFGLVDAERVDGDISVTNANGGVTGRSIQGEAKVRTTFGAVTLSGVSGAVDVDDQNGSIDVKDAGRSGTDCKPITLRTSFGSVRVALPDGAGYDVDARTSFGAIRSDFPLSSERGVSSSTLAGRIGDGRCKLTVANSNGGIEILKAGPRK